MRATALAAAIVAFVVTTGTAHGALPRGAAPVLSVYVMPGNRLLVEGAETAAAIPFRGGADPSAIRVVIRNSTDASVQRIQVHVDLAGPGFVFHMRKIVYGLAPRARADVLFGRLTERPGADKVKFGIPLRLAAYAHPLPAGPGLHRGFNAAVTLTP